MARVAVYLTNYNSDSYVNLAVDSVLGQSFTDLDLLIFDNHSTDQAPRIFKAYAEQDPRVKVIDVPTGLAGIPLFDFAWRYLDKGSYDYSITLGGHDFWDATNFLKVLVNRMDIEIQAFGGNTALCYVDTWQKNMAGETIGRFQNIMQFGQVPRAFTPMMVIGTVDSPQLFGLWCERVRKAVSPMRYMCGGWDHLVVMHAALFGRIIFEGNAKLWLRAPPPGDGPDKYGQRHFAKDNLARGAQDFIDQLEWCVHCVKEATRDLGPEASPTYRMMLTASMVELYCTLRGTNLMQIPGAFQQFTQNPNTIEMMKGAHHTLRFVEALIRGCKPQTK